MFRRLLSSQERREFVIVMRPMRRNKQQLSEDRCRELLRILPRGVLAFSESEGYPYAVPIDFYFDGEKNVIYFHGAKEGKKSELVAQEPKVCFVAYNDGYRKEDDWALTIDSIIVYGRIHIVEDIDESLEVLKNMGRRYFPDKAEGEAAAERNKGKALCYYMTIDTITGKTVHEK